MLNTGSGTILNFLFDLNISAKCSQVYCYVICLLHQVCRLCLNLMLGK